MVRGKPQIRMRSTSSSETWSLRREGKLLKGPSPVIWKLSRRQLSVNPFSGMYIITSALLGVVTMPYCSWPRFAAGFWTLYSAD